MDALSQLLYLNSRDLKGRTAMHLAVEGGHEGVVRTLVDNGADVRPQDFLGRTPLQRASTLGKDAVVALLLSYGNSST